METKAHKIYCTKNLLKIDPPKHPFYGEFGIDNSL